MGQAEKLFRVSTLSGACVLCVLVRHLMGYAGGRAARLKPQSASTLLPRDFVIFYLFACAFFGADREKTARQTSRHYGLMV